VKAQDIIVSVGDNGVRLDVWLTSRLPGLSRSRLQTWIRHGKVSVNGTKARPSLTLREGDRIEVEPEPLPSLRAEAEEIPLDVLYIDDDVIVVNKAAGMVVHAGAGNHSGTLVNALLHRFGQLSNVSGEDRPGIVHRIDRETSGVLVVARHDAAHRSLAEQFASREVQKQYIALVQGKTKTDSGQIESLIERDPVRRVRMTTRTGRGRTANTWWTVRQRFERFTLLDVRIGTGRTHQIRVHMSSVGHAVAGDTLYGAAPGPLDRFFLHAARLTFRQPSTGQPVTVEAPLPPELQEWLRQMGNGSVK